MSIDGDFLPLFYNRIKKSMCICEARTMPRRQQSKKKATFRAKF